MGKPQIRAVVGDLDNTCWDWMGFYIPAMQRFTHKVAEIAGVTPEVLYPEIRSIHQRHGTSEYGWVLQEMPTLQHLKEATGDLRPLSQIYKPAIDVYCEERDRRLALYPGVSSFFNTLGAKGTLRIAFTEAQAFYTFSRFKKTGLDNFIDVLYTPPDSDIPQGVDLAAARSNPPSYYRLNHAQHRALPKGARKPNPELLMQILDEHKLRPQEVLVFGDHLWKDVWMAQQVGCHNAHAFYGDYSRMQGYGDFMPKVSFYTDAHFEEEKVGRASAGHIKADHVLQEGPTELLQMFDFVQGPKRARLPRGHKPVIHPL